MRANLYSILLSVKLLFLSVYVSGQCDINTNFSNASCTGSNDGSISVIEGASCDYTAPYGTENANTILNSSKSNYNLVGIEKVVVTSGFNGTITVNSLHGKLVIDEAVTLQSLDFKYGEVLITKNGSLTVPNINIGKRNNWAKIKNYGVLNVTGTSSKVKSFIQNYGVINVSGDLLLGQGSKLSNYCTVKIANKLKVIGGFGFYNYNGLIKTGATILNQNYQSRLYNESILETRKLRLKPGASIQGFSYNATLKVTNSLVVFLGAMINGNLELCVEGNEKNSGTIIAARACNNTNPFSDAKNCSDYKLFKLGIGNSKTLWAENAEGKFFNLPKGLYLVESSCDACQNSTSSIINITEKKSAQFSLNYSNTNEGECTGSAQVQLPNNGEIFSTLWSNNINENHVNNLCEGNYYVEVTTETGCVSRQNFSINTETENNPDDCDVSVEVSQGCSSEGATINVLGSGEPSGGSPKGGSCGISSGIANNIAGYELDDKLQTPKYGYYMGDVAVVRPGKTFSGNIQLNGGKLIVFGDIDFANIIFNYGEVIIAESATAQFSNFNLNMAQISVTNYGELNISSSYNSVSGSIHNYGVIHNSGGLILSSSASFNNYCTYNSKGSLNLNGAEFTNHGTANIEANSTFSSSSVLDLKPGSKYTVQNLTLNGAHVSNTESECAQLSVLGNLQIYAQGSIGGNIKYCQPSGTQTLYGKIETTVEQTCEADCGSETAEEKEEEPSCVYTLTKRSDPLGINPPAFIASSTNGEFKNIKPGKYTITSICGGCVATKNININAEEGLELRAFKSTPGDSYCSGLAYAVASGGSGNYNYSWSNGETGSCLSYSAPNGFYTVTVSDGTECTAKANVNINGNGDECTVSPFGLSAGCDNPSSGALFFSVQTPSCFRGPIMNQPTCESCTKELSFNENIVINNGDDVCITEGLVYGGSITMNGGKLTICGDALPSEFVMKGGELIVNGSLTTSSEDVSINGDVMNFGRIEVAKLSFDGNLNNFGKINIQGEVRNYGKIRNLNKFAIGGNYKGAYGVLENFGPFGVAGNIYTGNADQNDCSVIVGGNINITGTYTNNSLLIVEGTVKVESERSLLEVGEKGVVKASIVYNSGRINSAEGIIKTSQSFVNTVGGDISGMLKLCSGGNFQNYGTIGATVRSSCSDEVLDYVDGCSYKVTNEKESYFTTTSSVITGLEVGNYTIQKTCSDCNSSREVKISKTQSCSFGEQCGFKAGIVSACEGVPSGHIFLIKAQSCTDNYTYEWRTSGESEVIQTSKYLVAVEPGDYDVTLNNQTTGLSENFTLTVPIRTGSCPPNPDNESCTQSAKLYGYNAGCKTAINGVARVFSGFSFGSSGNTYTWYKNGSEWVSGQGMNIHRGLGVGSYYVEVSKEGCDTKTTKTIDIEAEIVDDCPECFSAEVNTTASQNVSCLGKRDGGIAVDITGGSGVFSAIWFSRKSPDDKWSWKPFLTNRFAPTNLYAGEYKVIIRDKNDVSGLNCSQTLTYSLTEKVPANVDITDWSDICYGTSSATLTAEASSGQIVWHKEYIGEIGRGTTIDVTESGKYYVQLEGTSCIDMSGNVSVYVAKQTSDVRLTKYNDDLCENIGETVRLRAFGTGRVTWDSDTDWEFTNTTNTQDVGRAGTYTVTLSARGCTDLIASQTIALDECKKTSPFCEPKEWPRFELENPCQENFDLKVETAARYEHDRFVEAITIDFKKEYIASCLANLRETWKETHNDYLPYQQTLYYYDQAGNLVQTVAPKGVKTTNGSTNPNHTFRTTYEYNSLNQVIGQRLPDHNAIDGNAKGHSQVFWYDALGRIILSHNSNQESVTRDGVTGKEYAYTLYDELGRIYEVGSIIAGELGALNVHGGNVIEYNEFEPWVKSKNKFDFTYTKWDFPNYRSARSGWRMRWVAGRVPGFPQENTRSRIAQIEHHKSTFSGRDYATYYTYDELGNVKSLIQENIDLADVGRQFTRIDYEYELASGNVTKVYYQKGKAEQFIHKYEYDADGRIQGVFTSRDDIAWDRDVKYEYYLHGPLARKVLGDDIQGVDYAYTIQGWIKAVNSEAVRSGKDMGGDGATGSSVAGDVYGYSLDYFENDYTSIGASSFIENTTGSFDNGAVELFNGNISQMVTSVNATTANSKVDLAIGASYQYDQLNRLVSSRVQQDLTKDDATWLGEGNQDAYATNYTYDANGNINHLDRKTKDGTAMDAIDYDYGTTDWNRLLAIYDTDGKTTANDIDDAVYTYDDMGNLTSDSGEEIADIEWNNQGKVSKVVRNGANQNDLELKYDAFGNRVVKVVKPRDASGNLMGQNNWKYTYYTRDASGQVMTVYERKYGGSGNLFQNTFNVKEQPIYGTEREGTSVPSRTNLRWKSFSVSGFNTDGTFKDMGPATGAVNGGGAENNIIENHKIGDKKYELKNHLGNVIAVVSDKTSQIDVDSDGDYDSQEVLALDVSLYYPFGMRMQGVGATGDYRYGFQGAETDDEVSGTGNSYAWTERSYDPRIARWSAVDGAASSYPQYSTYSFTGLNPIMNKEIDGDVWDIVADVGFILYDLGEIAYDYSTTGKVDPISVAALSADVTMAFIPIGTGGGLAVRASAEGTETVVKKVTAEAVEEGAEKFVIKNNNARQLLEKRGLSKQEAKDVVGSFDGDITLTKGKKGDVFDITESSKGAASGNYVTRGSAGKTPAERIDNLALPPNNTAKRTGKVELGRDQNLLEGKVKENYEKPGGGHQVVTDGGRKTGAVKDID